MKPFILRFILHHPQLLLVILDNIWYVKPCEMKNAVCNSISYNYCKAGKINAI